MQNHAAVDVPAMITMPGNCRSVGGSSRLGKCGGDCWLGWSGGGRLDLGMEAR